MINITKSKSDKRSYLYTELLNGLKVVIISDPDTDKSACAMNVSIGSLCDPIEYQGMAHFLEHMLFMGTEKYPDENKFGEFINENSGSTNAFTDFDSTNYYFDISNESFDKAIDIFAQFFIHPIFKENSVEREMNAVDSEFKKNLRDDGWRSTELIYSESVKKSPFSKFSTGNNLTLKKPGVRQALIQFHKTYYSAHLMYLCVLNKKSIDELNKIVEDVFGKIPSFPVNLPNFSDPFPFSKKYLGNLYYITPVREEDSLKFSWIVEYAGSHYKSKPLYYLSALFGHEGPNSLFSSLIKDGLATELETDYSNIAKTFSSFSIDITLTNKGYLHWDEVCKRVLYFVKKIKSEEINKEFFDDLQQLAQINFDFSEKEFPYDYCSDIVSYMQKYKVEDILTGPELIEEFNEELIRSYLDDLQIDNLNVYISSKKLKKKCNLKEKWYHTRFAKKKFPPEVYDYFENCDIADNVCEHNLDYPPKNSFIPNNIDLLPHPEVANVFPIVIHKDNLSTVWYKQDTTFQLPKVMITVQVYLNRNFLPHCINSFITR